MAKDLTDRQREVLNAIRDYSWEQGYPPSIRELGKMLGISSLRGVTIHLDALERKGWIQRERTSRSIRILVAENAVPAAPPVCVPLCGSVEDGRRAILADSGEAYVAIPTEIAAKGPDLFALRVKGNELVEKQILDGDMIIVLSGKRSRRGESDSEHQPLEITDQDGSVIGTVVGLIRSYPNG